MSNINQAPEAKLEHDNDESKIPSLVRISGQNCYQRVVVPITPRYTRYAWCSRRKSQMKSKAIIDILIQIILY